jgi:hypothetical protein
LRYLNFIIAQVVLIDYFLGFGLLIQLAEIVLQEQLNLLSTPSTATPAGPNK